MPAGRRSTDLLELRTDTGPGSPRRLQKQSLWFANQDHLVGAPQRQGCLALPACQPARPLACFACLVPFFEARQNKVKSLPAPGLARYLRPQGGPAVRPEPVPSSMVQMTAVQKTRPEKPGRIAPVQSRAEQAGRARRGQRQATTGAGGAGQGRGNLPPARLRLPAPYCPPPACPGPALRPSPKERVFCQGSRSTLRRAAPSAPLRRRSCGVLGGTR